MTERCVSLTINTDDDSEFALIFEQLSRICAGMILSGKEARVFACELVDVEEDAT